MLKSVAMPSVLKVSGDPMLQSNPIFAQDLEKRRAHLAAFVAEQELVLDAALNDGFTIVHTHPYEDANTKGTIIYLHKLPESPSPSQAISALIKRLETSTDEARERAWIDSDTGHLCAQNHPNARFDYSSAWENIQDIIMDIIIQAQKDSQ